jgi:hypothetical protein
MIIEQLQQPQGKHIALVDSRSLQSATTTSEDAQLLSLDRIGSVGDRRRGTSDPELASMTLMHAVRYLVAEQRAGNCTSVRANRQAVNILCDSANEIVEVERREPTRNKLRSWLRSL